MGGWMKEWLDRLTQTDRDRDRQTLLLQRSALPQRGKNGINPAEMAELGV
ncbi:hypothetical protein ACN6KS_03515 [Paenibacillus nitricinens]